MNNEFLIYNDIELEGLKIDLLLNNFINENNNIKRSLNNEVINENIDIKATIKDKIIKILDSIWEKIKDFFKKLLLNIKNRLSLNIIKHESVYDSVVNVEYIIKQMNENIDEFINNPNEIELGTIYNINCKNACAELENISTKIYNKLDTYLSNKCTEISQVINKADVKDENGKVKSVEEIIDEIKNNRDLAKFVLSEYKISNSIIDKKDNNADFSKLTKIINTNDIVKSLYGERNIIVTNKNIIKYKPMIEESIKTRGSAIVTIHKGFKATKAIIEDYKTTANTLDKLFKETNKDLTTKYCTCCATSINYVKNVSYLSINVITKILGSYDPIIKKIIRMDNDEEISNKASQYIENL